MPESSQRPLARLAADLRRPAGGWTVGVLTLLATIGIGLVSLLGYWPGPTGTGQVAMWISLLVHVGWGSAGYYPNRIR